jgi:hypothetical protein
MKQALTMAHKNNNAKAISKDFAAGCGVPENVFTSWVTWCNSLHYAIAPWIKKFNDKDVTDKELKEIYDKVFPILKQLAKVDDKPLFIRESDVVYLCGKAHLEGKSANGSVDVLIGQVAFRRKVEFMFGNRLAQNEVLTEDDYDIIVKYDSAVKNKTKAENRLDGYTNTKGEKVLGLKEQLEEAKKTLDNVKALAISMGADKEKIEENAIVIGYVANVTKLENDIKSTEKNITKAKETIKKLGKDYKNIMATINEIK